jgi:hypothetical protein
MAKFLDHTMLFRIPEELRFGAAHVVAESK